MDSYTFINKIKYDNEFENMYKEKIISDFRMNLYYFLISRTSEDDFFDLCSIPENHREDVVKIVGEELIQVGWKWQLSYGDTGLFIFKGDVPKNCW